MEHPPPPTNKKQPKNRKFFFKISYVILKIKNYTCYDSRSALLLCQIDITFPYRHGVRNSNNPLFLEKWTPKHIFVLCSIINTIYPRYDRFCYEGIPRSHQTTKYLNAYTTWLTALNTCKKRHRKWLVKVRFGFCKQKVWNQQEKKEVKTWINK